MTVLIPELSRAMDAAGLSHYFITGDQTDDVTALYCWSLGTERQPNAAEILVRSAERPDRIAGFEVRLYHGATMGKPLGIKMIPIRWTMRGCCRPRELAFRRPSANLFCRQNLYLYA